MPRIQWKSSLPAAALVALAAIAGFLLSPHLPRSGTTLEPRLQKGEHPPGRDTGRISPASTPSAQATRRTKFVPPEGAIKNEMLLRFTNAAAMQAFLDQAVKVGGRGLGVIPGLHAVRIGFDNSAQGDELRSLAPDSATVGFNYPVRLPPAPDSSKQDVGGPYQAFGNRALAWLGVPADNTAWGKGVTVAVLDTSMTTVPGLQQNSINTIDLVGQSGGDLRHGTAMASIIAGNSTEAPGIAPSAQLLGITVLNGNGAGDAFTVAQGILDAVDSGARVISMSLGAQGDSSILQDAVNYALSHEVAVVAAVGNEGTGSVDYPAKYPGVIGVTAVDANGQRAQFANYGPEVSIAAPGIGVYTPWTADTVMNISGTSPAVPFVSGALAAILSQNPGMTVQTAEALLIQYANDAGAPGPDPMFGAGILSLDRVQNRNQTGINDAAVADVYYGTIPGRGDTPTLAVAVQNRGTTSLYNVKLEVSVGGQPQTFHFDTLSVGEVKSGIIPLAPAQLQTPNGIMVRSQVSLAGVQDAKPANDTKSVVLKAKGP